MQIASWDLMKLLFCHNPEVLDSTSKITYFSRLSILVNFDRDRTIYFVRRKLCSNGDLFSISTILQQVNEERLNEPNKS